MKKFKSLISCLLAVIILISACSIASFAFTPEEFNLENVTWEDIMTMSNSDFRKLLSDFERVYDPFGTYEENPIMHNNKKTFAWKMQPYWTSGKEDLSEMGCHELITARGCGVLLKDKGFWGENENGSILIALSLSLASVIPDRRSEYIGLIPYQGHFYDPDTELSIFGNDKNTAKTNAIFFL